MKLNLGAADRNFPDFFSVDIVPPADFVCDLSLSWPWKDSSVSEVVAYDVIEHIGDCPHVGESGCKLCISFWQRIKALLGFGFFVFQREPRHEDGRIHFMNELHRVLVAGGTAKIETPNASRGAGFFQDPTHKKPWVMNSFQYFEDGSLAHNRLAKSYGITARFKVLSLTEQPYQDKYEQVWKITAVLEAVK